MLLIVIMVLKMSSYVSCVLNMRELKVMRARLMCFERRIYLFVIYLTTTLVAQTIQYVP
jgi:hypothetical protein